MLILFYLFLAVIVSFICSLLESVLLSVTTSYLAVKAKEGKAFGILLKKQKEDIDRSLAAVLTLNTIANTVGAAGVGAQVLRRYGDEFVAVASAALTFTILIFPKLYLRQLARPIGKLLLL